MSAADLSAASVAEDAITLCQMILESEYMEDDHCSALAGFTLCGSSWCEQGGCIVDKLKRAQSFLASETPEDGR